MWRESSEILEDILEIEPEDAHSYLALARLESRRERGGRVGRVRRGKEEGNGESVSDTAAAGEEKEKKEEASDRRRYKDAREIFQIGTAHCPKSVHLYHAWGMHEQSLGNISKAKELFDMALVIDPWNGYVCHAYGLLEMQHGSSTADDEARGKGRLSEGINPRIYGGSCRQVVRKQRNERSSYQEGTSALAARLDVPTLGGTGVFPRTTVHNLRTSKFRT